MLASLLHLTATASASAAVIEQLYTFERPQVTAEFNGDIIVMENCRTGGASGSPALPSFGVKMLLPPGEEVVSVEVLPGEPQLLSSNLQIAPNQEQLPFSYEGEIALINPNSNIYNQDRLFPAQLNTPAQTRFYRGHSVAFLQINPVRYNPVQREVWWYPELRVKAAHYTCS
jgi:hypothetical protein